MPSHEYVPSPEGRTAAFLITGLLRQYITMHDQNLAGGWRLISPSGERSVVPTVSVDLLGTWQRKLARAIDMAGFTTVTVSPDDAVLMDAVNQVKDADALLRIVRTFAHRLNQLELSARCVIMHRLVVFRWVDRAGQELPPHQLPEEIRAIHMSLVTRTTAFLHNTFTAGEVPVAQTAAFDRSHIEVEFGAAAEEPDLGSAGEPPPNVRPFPGRGFST